MVLAWGVFDRLKEVSVRISVRVDGVGAIIVLLWILGQMSVALRHIHKCHCREASVNT